MSYQKRKLLKINFSKLGRRLLRILAALVFLYGLSLVFVYFKQERFFFNPKHLDKDYVFSFEEDFEELNIPVAKNIALNALLFKTEQPRKGVIVYFHGNAGAIHDWGKRAPLYLDNGYDILFFDYRNYGKSDGEYCNTEDLLNDSQAVYSFTKQRYQEDTIIVLGYSLGSGLATYVASKNNPKMLILNAPYFSWKTLVADEVAPPPTFEYIKDVTCPINIFYGTRDFLINPETNAKKLESIRPNKTSVHPITDGGHNGLHITKEYYDELKKIL